MKKKREEKKRERINPDSRYYGVEEEKKTDII